MFRDTTIDQTTKLQERNLLHKRITDLADLHEIYMIGDVIGKGNFGTVVEAEHRETKVSWAIKIINKRQAGASRVLSVEREIYILKLVKHPNVIYLDCVFESPKVIYLVFELCTGSLAKIFNLKKKFQEKDTVNVIRGLSRALSYLHKNDIVHRDLKLENILTADNPHDSDDKLFIKVTDFGLSAMRTGPGHDNMLHDCCGTLAYMAPEMIVTKSYSQQCDVWSMGVIMYLLLFGKFPFFSTNDQQLCALISKADIDFSGLSCSAEARNLLSKLLERNPAFRFTAAEVNNHPWISGITDNLQTESSNVLDMMHLWRDEMLESSHGSHSNGISVNERKAIETGESKEDVPLEEETQLTLVNFADGARSSKQLWRNTDRSRISHVDTETTPKLLPGAIDGTSRGNRFESMLVHIRSLQSWAKAISTYHLYGRGARKTVRSILRLTKLASSNRRCMDLTSVVLLQYSVPGTQTAKENSTNKRCRRKSSRLPDFSHIPAKVDSNLGNLRKEAQKRRDSTRKLAA